jgi:hypothetical protein
MLYSIVHSGFAVNSKRRSAMMDYLEALLRALRPAFTRQAAFAWFVVAFAGVVMRQDFYGVSSIVRALSLAPVFYPALLHFFHSAAWTAQLLYRQWEQWLIRQPVVERAAGRAVLLGDHTKQPKDGRRMPEVSTLHQDSETSSKPSFFRGHHWGCLSLLGQAQGKRFALPLWAEIHPDACPDSRATRLVHVAAEIGLRLREAIFLVLDAFFAVGPVFRAAAESKGRLHILTRAKKNVVAFQPPPIPPRPHRGRPRLYGKKLKLLDLFDTRPSEFRSAKALVYQQMETVRYLVLDLIWKPAKVLVRFILIETSRGRLILMSSDLTIEALLALSLYTARVRIESLFNSVKNLLGGLAYHFWSKYLAPVSRRPKRGTCPSPVSSRPNRTANTLAAIEKFMALHLIVLGALQLLAATFADAVRQHARCWLRTPTGAIPSDFVCRTALANLLHANIRGLAQNPIIALIRRKQISLRTNRENNVDQKRRAA